MLDSRCLPAFSFAHTISTKDSVRLAQRYFECALGECEEEEEEEDFLKCQKLQGGPNNLNSGNLIKIEKKKITKNFVVEDKLGSLWEIFVGFWGSFDWKMGD